MRQMGGGSGAAGGGDWPENQRAAGDPSSVGGGSEAQERAISEAEARAKAREERVAAMQDDDAPDIPPALTPSEWERREWLVEAGSYDGINVEVGVDGEQELVIASGGDIVRLEREELHVSIALANEALHDEDPRKLRREHVTALRNAANDLRDALRDLDVTADVENAKSDNVDTLDDLADALESYLPPIT